MEEFSSAEFSLGHSQNVKGCGGGWGGRGGWQSGFLSPQLSFFVLLKLFFFIQTLIEEGTTSPDRFRKSSQVLIFPVHGYPQPDL